MFNFISKHDWNILKQSSETHEVSLQYMAFINPLLNSINIELRSLMVFVYLGVNFGVMFIHLGSSSRSLFTLDTKGQIQELHHTKNVLQLV